MIVAVVVLLAGCPQLDGGSDGSPDDIESADPETSSEELTESFSTGEVLVNLREIPALLNSTGERLQVKSELSDAARDSLESRGMLRFHERSFTHSVQESSTPEIVISTAVVYESEAVATEQLDATFQNYSRAGANVSSTAFGSDVSATRVQFENDRGLMTVGYFYRSESLVFHTLVADTDAFHDEVAREIFIEMYSDFVNIQR